MAKKTGLGKGLDALFASTVEEERKEEEIQAGEKIHKLKLIEIEPNRNQPRKKFDEEALEELANSIKAISLFLLSSSSLIIAGISVNPAFLQAIHLLSPATIS